MNAVTHLEKVIVGEVSAVTHLEKVIAGETSAVTYTEKVITGEAPPITHLQKVIAGEASPVTHLEYVWAGSTPSPTEPEYTGAVPYTFTADGSPLISWRISGNTVQNGTPTPDNPIMPEGTGDRTGNLFDINATPTKYSQSTTVTVDGRTLTITGTWYIYYEIDVVPNTDYYIKWTINYAEIKERGSIAILTTSGQTIHNQSADPYSFNSGENQRIRLYIYAGNSISGTVRLSNIMLNTGSTALPYEPYGIKIPISSANTTTPVYLGEVETTRKIKKLVLTGEEWWGKEGRVLFYNDVIIKMPAVQYADAYCSHYRLGSSYTDVAVKEAAFGISKRPAIFIHDSRFSTVADLKSYLAAQYAAGTPVCVWYVLATSETAVVNEPLMKIGDYADEVSNVATIPTNNGSNTFDVDTAVKPSEVYIKYKGV